MNLADFAFRDESAGGRNAVAGTEIKLATDDKVFLVGKFLHALQLVKLGADGFIEDDVFCLLQEL